jgi:hypothetical protein
MTSSPATHAYVPPVNPPVDPFRLPLLNDTNVAEFRAHHGVRTHADLHQVMATRDVLATAHDALLDPPFDPGDFRDALDGLAMAIETLDAVITPTEEALADFFVEDWALVVIDGECRVRYQPLSEEDWRERMKEEAA